MNKPKQTLLLTYFSKELTTVAAKLHSEQDNEAGCQLDESDPTEQNSTNKCNNNNDTTENEAQAASQTKTKPSFSSFSNITFAAYSEWVLEQISNQSSFGREKLSTKISLSAHLGKGGVERESAKFLATLGGKHCNMKTL